MRELTFFTYDPSEQEELWKKTLVLEETINRSQLIKLIRGWDHFVRMTRNAEKPVSPDPNRLNFLLKLINFLGKKPVSPLTLESCSSQIYNITTEELLKKVLENLRISEPYFDEKSDFFKSLVFITDEINFFQEASRLLCQMNIMFKEEIYTPVDNIIGEARKAISANFSLEERKKILQKYHLAIEEELIKIEEMVTPYNKLDKYCVDRKDHMQNLLVQWRSEGKCLKNGEKLKEETCDQVHQMIRKTKLARMHVFLGGDEEDSKKEKRGLLWQEVVEDIKKSYIIFYEKIAEERDPILAELMSIKAEMKRIHAEIFVRNPNHSHLKFIDQVCSKIDAAKKKYTDTLMTPTKINETKLNSITKNCVIEVKSIVQTNLVKSKIPSSPIHYSTFEKILRVLRGLLESLGKLPIQPHPHATSAPVGIHILFFEKSQQAIEKVSSRLDNVSIPESPELS
ncbi:Uncharacterised protein [Legionella busanensis]|uniref:Uncharacterized protein n=1 Tax=Legionella busanensis TaxID=190655 RepID=A0A378JL52_9GAMM|nr:hypothetical protein [Legionella busanensis]STX51924.1 Uncharacterised protein [Legionella busanensis]